jgi:1-acyl-sn-glycerol-3-phosphate acyltransferase
MTGGPDREAPRAPGGVTPPTAAESSTAREQERNGPGPEDATSPAPAQERPGSLQGSRWKGPGPQPKDPDPPAQAPDPGAKDPDPRAQVPDPGASHPDPATSHPDPAASDPGPGAKEAERGYRIAQTVVKPLMRTWFRIRLEGHEHIPEAGPVILASNHRSNMDPVLLASAVERPVAFMAKAELFAWPLGPIMRWIGQFPVRRGGIDREALRQTDAVLARGSMLGLFPEGTRGDGAFSAVHPGLAYIVVRQRCPVLPVVIFGTERVRRRFGWLPFASPVRIVVGPPIDLPKSAGDRAGRRAASQVLQRRLQAFRATAAGEPAPLPTTSIQIDE